MAIMPNVATSYAETRQMLECLVDKPLMSKTGQVATISKNSIDELMSGKAVRESMNRDAHLLACANIEKLYSNAILKWEFELDSGKTNENLGDRKYLYAPMKFGKEIIPVKFTVKEFKSKKPDNRIYSIKAINVIIK